VHSMLYGHSATVRHISLMQSVTLCPCIEWLPCVLRSTCMYGSQMLDTHGTHSFIIKLSNHWSRKGCVSQIQSD
jgi:hypothetical protein